MKRTHQIYHAADILEQPNSIICDSNMSKILKSTIYFITELLKIKLDTAIAVSLTSSKNRLELCFLYRARCYNPLIEDTDPENPPELFLRRYYEDITFSYNGNTNKLLFTYRQEQNNNQESL